MTFYNLAQSSRTDIDGICAFPVSVTSSSRQIALMVRGAPVGASNGKKAKLMAIREKPWASTSITSQKLSTFALLNAA
jgi:hypothetical protein